MGATFFFVYEILIEVDHQLSVSPSCPYDHKSYPMWYWHTCYCVCGGFLITALMLALKICFSTGDQAIPYKATFAIVSMASTATILSLTMNWGGTCIDYFGYVQI